MHFVAFVCACATIIVAVRTLYARGIHSRRKQRHDLANIFNRPQRACLLSSLTGLPSCLDTIRCNTDT
jgi:hypothetical protein